MNPKELMFSTSYICIIWASLRKHQIPINIKHRYFIFSMKLKSNCFFIKRYINPGNNQNSTTRPKHRRKILLILLMSISSSIANGKGIITKQTVMDLKYFIDKTYIYMCIWGSITGFLMYCSRCISQTYYNMSLIFPSLQRLSLLTWINISCSTDT